MNEILRHQKKSAVMMIEIKWYMTIGSRERDGEMERVGIYRRTVVSNNNVVVVVVCYCLLYCYACYKTVIVIHRFI